MSLSRIAALALAFASPLAPAADYAIDPTHTFVHFEVLHLGTSTTRGRFDKSAGTLAFERGGRTGKVSIDIDTASVNTGVAALDKVLRGERFFDVARYASASFVSERFEFDGNRLAEVAGTLTLLGQAQPVVLKATRFNCYLHPFLRRETCGGDFEATVRRSQWGMSAFAPDVVADEVHLAIQIEAIRQ